MKYGKIFVALIAIFIIISLGFVWGIDYWAKRLYPLDYLDEIKKNTEAYNLEKELVCAIIYEESKFEPDVVSDKGAIGLMQIMPDTANFLAPELGINRLLRDDLFIPEVNIRFGTYYFRSLLDRYDGNQDLGLAAYNAGFGAVDKAVGNINNLPEETKEFIKRNKETEKIYLTLYADKLEIDKEKYRRERLSFWQITGIVWRKANR